MLLMYNLYLLFYKMNDKYLNAKVFFLSTTYISWDKNTS